MSTAAVAEWAQAASRHGLLAYCEAAYANGMGGQSAVIWQDGAEVKRLDDDDSVNQALRLPGVTCEEGEDEWDTVGLGTAGTSTCMAMRSSSGPEIRER